jgi:hypothetical protein
MQYEWSEKIARRWTAGLGKVRIDAPNDRFADLHGDIEIKAWHLDQPQSIWGVDLLPPAPTTSDGKPVKALLDFKYEGATVDALNTAAILGLVVLQTTRLRALPRGGPRQPPRLPAGTNRSAQPHPERRLPAFEGGKTAGEFRAPDGTRTALRSGIEGPGQAAPRGRGSGFDAYTRTHVEGHAAALMREQGLMEGVLRINNLRICVNCQRNLRRMLPPGGKLTVVLPDGSSHVFMGVQ